MNKAEAKKIIEEKINLLRGESYSELRRFIDDNISQVVIGESGIAYNVEVQIFWDDKKNGNLRIAVAIDDGNLLSSVSPLCDDFILAPDGTFVGE